MIGDNAILGKLQTALKDPSAAVVQASVSALTCLAVQGNQAVLDSLLTCSEHPDGWVRRKLPGALVAFAETGCNSVVAVLAAYSQFT